MLPLRLALFLLLLAQSLPAVAAIDQAVRVSTWGQKVLLPPGKMWIPTAIAVDSGTGDVFTAESARLTRWSRSGGVLASWTCLCQGVAVNSETHDVYATSWTNDKVYQFSASGTAIREWGGFGSAQGQFREPFGIEVDPTTGSVYVADPGNSRVQVFDSTGNFLRQITAANLVTSPGEPMSVAFDPARRVLWVTSPGDNLIFKFSESGVLIRQIGTVVSSLTPGVFRWPRSVDVDALGQVFVTDTDSELVEYLNADGYPLGQFQGPNDIVAGPFHPRDVAVNRATGEVFVLAAYANRVDRFSPTLQYETSFGQPQTGGPFFLLPRGIATAPSNGDLYIADSANFVIKRATPGGAMLGQWGGSWNIDHAAPGLLGSFTQSALAVDPDGNVWAGYVGIHYHDDPPVQNIQQFDSVGGHLRSFFRVPPLNVRFESVIHLAIDPATRHIWVANGDGFVDHYNTEGFVLEHLDSFGSPVGVALRGSYVYVADQGGFIHRLDTLGNRISFGGPGNGPGQLQLSDSSALATDPEGNVYVADTLNHRIQQFSPDGVFLGALGQFGNNPGQFNQPRGLAFSPDYSLLHVVEYSIHRIQTFCMPGFDVAHCRAQLDADGDDVLDSSDNCPFAPNPSQANTGGFNSGVPDSFGDACQCGSVDGNGLVSTLDVVMLRAALTGSVSIDPSLCSVYGDSNCDLVDVVVLARALSGRLPKVTQSCSAAQRPA